MLSVSVCTFTYNDSALACGFLEHIAGWSRRPDEVLLLDDGSTPPFVPPLSLAKALPLRILRLPVNQGFIPAKRAGISQAGGEFILAADCDVLLTPDYLERCLLLLEDRSVGMAAGASRQEAGQGVMADYLRFYGDNHGLNLSGPTPVEFIPGHAYAMRRAVWEEVGGFGETERASCEDHALCAAMRKAGYTLIMDPGILARQIRRVSRFAQCARIWEWCGAPLLEELRAFELSLPEYLEPVLFQPALGRMEDAARRGSLACAYIELLHLAHMGLRFCLKLGAEGRLPPEAGLSFAQHLEGRLKPFPRLRRLLRADLLRLSPWPPPRGKEPAPEDASPLARLCPWEEVLRCLDALGQSGLLAWLDQRGVALILAEDEAEQADFSAYAPAP